MNMCIDMRMDMCMDMPIDMCKPLGREICSSEEVAGFGWDSDGRAEACAMII